MEDIKQLENKELEKVAGGSSVESYQGFSVGDWVRFKPGTRHSPRGGSGLSRPYFRIREFNVKCPEFVIAELDMYDLNPLGGYTIMSGSSYSLDELEHSNAPLGFEE